METALKKTLEEMEFGEPQVHENMTVVPIVNGHSSGGDEVPDAEAGNG